MLEVNSLRIGRGFDLLAWIYDSVVRLTFGNAIDQLEHDLLSELPPREHCLIVGGGTGRILKSAIQHKISESYIYAELSEAMQKKTKKRLSSDELMRVSFRQGFQSIDATNKFDYIILPFVLDCYPEATIAQMLKALRNLLDYDGRILFLDFNHEVKHGFNGGLLHIAFTKLLYFFFHNVTGIPAKKLAPFNPLFEEARFKAERRLFIRNGWIQAIEWRKGSNRDESA